MIRHTICGIAVGVIAAASAAWVFWIHSQEMVFRKIGTVAVLIFAALLIGLVLVLLVGKTFKGRMRRTFFFFLAMAGVIGVLAALLRYDGSLDGSSMPQFTWRWAPDKDAALPALAISEAAPDDPLAGAADFIQFLGPNRDGVIGGVTLDPDWKSNPPEEVWRRPIGVGWSGFAVSGRRAITQEQRGETELVSCYDLGTGKPLWTHANTVRFTEGMGGPGPRATPTIHGHRVYAIGATGILDCLTLATGKPLWTRPVLDDPAKNLMYGKTSSPLIEGDLAIVSGGKGGPSVIAFNKDTGDRVWAAGEDDGSYAVPAAADLAGRRQILSVNGNSVTGHDPGTGEVLWTFDWPGKYPHVAQPQVVGGDRILVTASYGMGSFLFKVFKAGDGKFEVREVWETSRMKTKFSNACLRGGHAYGLDEGRMACIDLETGDRVWKGGRYGYGQNLLVGEYLLVQAERGFIALCKADPADFVELARADALSSKTWNNPALAGRYLLVRNDEEAVCLRLPVRE